MISRKAALDAVANGRIFGAVFTKKNGEKRVMSARLGVRKNLTGSGLAFDPVEKNLLGVFDMNKRAYRFINLSTCSEIHAQGKTIK